ncbi:MAG TPA: argininosuccinate lyase [Candidatus Koribacter sp.]|jgi:argininosuccinate lyase
MKMWSGRFSQPLDPEFESWQRSLPFDRKLLKHEVAASGAHAKALAKAAVLSPAELAQILTGLEQIAGEGMPATDDPSIEDVHHFVESRLTAIAGEVGRKLHTGRSRNEQIATDLRLYVRDQLDSMKHLLADLIAALITQAEAMGDAAMPSYTHLQRAEPVLIAHWLLAYSEMFFRDIDRLADCRTRANLCPLGSAAVAGTFVELDRQYIAGLLNFDGPTANSIDATSDRDFAIEFAHALSVIGLHLSRMAEEMILFSTTEFGFLQLPEQYSTGSSAMPQKKNPDSMELIRGKSAALLANAMQLAVTLKSLPLAYNKDMQETQQPVFTVAEECAAMVRIAAGFVRTVKFNTAVMHTAASSGYMNAMSAAGYLVQQGIPFRRAHELIGAAVQAAIQKHCELQDLSAEDLRSIGIAADDGFYAALQLTAVLSQKNVEGGTAPSRVAAALKQAKAKLAALAEVQHACS